LRPVLYYPRLDIFLSPYLALDQIVVQRRRVTAIRDLVDTLPADPTKTRGVASGGMRAGGDYLNPYLRQRRGVDKEVQLVAHDTGIVESIIEGHLIHN
jgi:hypothetical protein